MTFYRYITSTIQCGSINYYVGLQMATWKSYRSGKKIPQI